MGIVTRDRLNEIIQSRITGTGDADIRDIEDLTDTLNDLEQRANADPENWRERYEQLDREWRERYVQRFFSPVPDSEVREPYKKEGNENIEVVDEPDENTITYDDLFKEV